MALSDALATREGAAKRSQGCMQARLLSLETVFDWGADAVAFAEGNTAAAFSRAVCGPCGVEEPVHACDLSMLRTGRSHDHPLVVMEGRVVRGRPRP